MNDENKDQQDDKSKERNWEKDWDEEKSPTAEKPVDDVSDKD